MIIFLECDSGLALADKILGFVTNHLDPSKMRLAGSMAGGSNFFLNVNVDMIGSYIFLCSPDEIGGGNTNQRFRSSAGLTVACFERPRVLACGPSQMQLLAITHTEFISALRLTVSLLKDTVSDLAQP